MNKSLKLWVAVWIAVLIATLSFSGAAETMYILCNPGSEVNVRDRPSTKGSTEGRMILGETVETDETKTDNTGRVWYHCTNLGFEANEGWICAAYVVIDPVDLTEYEATIDANGRVAAYRSISGERDWIKNGEAVHVYATAGEWAVTDKGYIRVKYLLFGDPITE